MIHLRARVIAACLCASSSSAFVAWPARSPWRQSLTVPRAAKPFDEAGGEALEGAPAEAGKSKAASEPAASPLGASPLPAAPDSSLDGTEFGAMEAEAHAAPWAADEANDAAAAATVGAAATAGLAGGGDGASTAEAIAAGGSPAGAALATDMVAQAEEFVALRYRAQADVAAPSKEVALAPLAGRAKRRAAEQAARAAQALVAVAGGKPSGKWAGAASWADEQQLDAAVKAHAGFYRALNQRDLGAMRRVWLEGSDADVQCTHPLFQEFASPDDAKDGGARPTGESAGRGLFVGGYQPVTDAFARVFKHSNSHKDDRIKRSKTVPTNVRARLLGPGTVLILCTDDITGPFAVGDGAKLPVKVTGASTALLRKDPVKQEWRIAHLHAGLCAASGAFTNDGQIVAASGSSSSSGPRIIRISGDGSGTVSSSGVSGGSGCSASASERAAEDLGLQIGELIAKEIAGNQGGDSTEKIIEQVLGGLVDDDDDSPGPRIVVVRRGDSGDDDEPRSQLRSALGSAIAAASGLPAPVGEALPGGKGFGTSSGGGAAGGQLDRIATALDQLVALQTTNRPGSSSAAAAASSDDDDGTRRHVREAARAVEATERRQHAVGAVRLLAAQGEVSPLQKHALLQDVVKHAYAAHAAAHASGSSSSVSPGSAAAGSAVSSAGAGAVSLVEAALELLVPDAEQAFDARLLRAEPAPAPAAAASVVAAAPAVAIPHGAAPEACAGGAVAGAHGATDEAQAGAPSLAAQLANVRRAAVYGARPGAADANAWLPPALAAQVSEGAEAPEGPSAAAEVGGAAELAEFAEQARAVADMLLEERARR